MIKEIKEWKSFGGYQKVYIHQSSELQGEKKIGVYLPPRAINGDKCNVLYWLTGATAKEEDFINTTGFQKYASQSNLIVVAPEPCPKPAKTARSPDIPFDEYISQFGWYVDAIKPPYKQFRTYSYWLNELLPMIDANFPTNHSKRGIFGHSMGGHGALMFGLKHPDLFQSISCLAPCCSYLHFQTLVKLYFGDDIDEAKKYDVLECVRNYNGPHRNILFDQAGSDEHAVRLSPGSFVDLLWNKNLSVSLRWHDGYVHTEGFIQTFIEDHINHHSKELGTFNNKVDSKL